MFCFTFQVVVYNPYLLMGARDQKNNGLLLVDNAAYQNAIQEGKAAGLVTSSCASTDNSSAYNDLAMGQQGTPSLSKG